MKINALGEFELIERLTQSFEQTLASGVIGIGDDCAVIPQARERSLVVTTDLLVEGVHFLQATTSACDLGYKALAVNLSDIAAMGAQPRSIFLSLALPAHLEISWIDEFFLGLRELARSYDVAILGGDTSRSLRDIVINVTAIGESAPEFIKLRSSAREGDILCVTKTLGDSAAGLGCLQAQGSINRESLSPEQNTLIARHLRPEPEVAEGLWLGQQRTVHAMMDLSDGLASDLARLMSSSGCGADVRIENLPLSNELKNVYADRAKEFALVGGEDYGLLLTVDAKACEQVQRDFELRFQKPLYAIGTITKKDLRYLEDGRPIAMSFEAFSHFKR